MRVYRKSTKELSALTELRHSLVIVFLACYCSHSRICLKTREVELYQRVLLTAFGEIKILTPIITVIQKNYLLSKFVVLINF